MKIKKPELWIVVEQKIKTAWEFLRDILSDKKVVRFTLSVKFFHDALSEPKTISMQGERSADGGWNTCMPRDQNSGTLPSAATLKEKLARIETHVREYIVENALEEQWDELEVLIKETLKSGFSAEDLEYRSEAGIWAIATSYQAHVGAPILATAYAIEGAEALGINDLIHASYCVDRGFYWSFSDDMFIREPDDRFSERASGGGKGRALRHEPVKNKVAELLMKLALDDGWKSTHAAIEAIVTELTAKHSSSVEACGLKTDNLPRTIRGWIQVDPERFSHRLKSGT